MKIIFGLMVLLLLSGCGITAAVQGAGAQIGPAVGAIDTDIYAIALAKYQSAQLFRAQMEGTVVLPPLPPPAPVSGPTPPSSAPPGIPVVVIGTPMPPSGTLPTGPTGR
jgi:hypothetical protein